MKKSSATFCKLANLSLAIQNEGDVCVCNKNNQSFENFKFGRQKMYLHEHGLQQMWESPTRKMIVTALDYDKKIPSCNSCWNDEAADVLSTRQKFNVNLDHVDALPDQPRVLILKPTNVCNMGCRTCQPSTSTTLYQDFFKLKTATGEVNGSFTDYTKNFESIRLGLGAANTALWDEFERWLPNLVFLDVYGGEPLLAPAMWERIYKLSEPNQLSNTAFQMHTNATLWDQQVADVLPKFKRASIAISIDSHDPNHLKYIRHRVNLESLYKNLDRYNDLKAKHTNISTHISLTVSAFNIWYLDEILDGLDKLTDLIKINVVYSPDQYDFKHLPIPIKNKLIDRFSSSNDPRLQQMVLLLKHTIPGCDIYWPKFWQEVVVLDGIRQQSFADTFPEFYKELIPYLPKTV